MRVPDTLLDAVKEEQNKAREAGRSARGAHVSGSGGRGGQSNSLFRHLNTELKNSVNRQAEECLKEVCATVSFTSTTLSNILSNRSWRDAWRVNPRGERTRARDVGGFVGPHALVVSVSKSLNNDKSLSVLRWFLPSPFMCYDLCTLESHHHNRSIESVHHIQVLYVLSCSR